MGCSTFAKVKISRQFQPTLYLPKSLIKAVGGQLLLCVSRRQMAKVLDDCGLPRFKVGESARHLFNLSLDAILTRLEPLKVFEHKVINSVVHFFPLVFTNTIKFDRIVPSSPCESARAQNRHEFRFKFIKFPNARRGINLQRQRHRRAQQQALRRGLRNQLIVSFQAHGLPQFCRQRGDAPVVYGECDLQYG